MTTDTNILSDKVRSAIRALPVADRLTVIEALDRELLHSTGASRILTPLQGAMVVLLSFHIRRSMFNPSTSGVSSFAEIV